MHPGGIPFLLDTFDAWGVTQVVHIGDVSDLHGPSFHDKHPDMPGPRDEVHQARECIQYFDSLLHKAGLVSKKNPLLVCEGNHDDRPKRVAAKYGVTSDFLVPHNAVWNTPNWRWALEHVIDDVLYMHGHKKCGGGEHPAHLTLKKGLDLSLVLGHYHTRGGVNPLPGRRSCRWGMDVGCLIDRLHPAMQYSESGSMKQMMSCGVVIDGHPYYEMMPCGPGQKYHRSKFKKKGNIWTA
jgi:predicted phosphodiesterase